MVFTLFASPHWTLKIWFPPFWSLPYEETMVPFAQYEKREKHHVIVLLLVKLQAKSSNFSII